MTDNNQSESFFKWGIPGLFLFIFIFSIQLKIDIQYNLFLMTGFEPLPSGVRSNRSTNWATTTALQLEYLILAILTFVYDFDSRKR